MNRCWEEGEWRAYLDGELPAEDMVRAGEHLAVCPSCNALHQEVAARASRVSAWMAELQPIAAPAVLQPLRRPMWQWAAAGIALAAGLAAAFVLAPKSVEPVLAPPSVAQLPPEPAVMAAAPTMQMATPAMAHQVSRPRSLRRRTPAPQYYMALDDQPIDTGMVMRVALENGIEADVIVDSGGRARAIRAVH
jgi:anti-sigma factor RsiW